MSSITLLLARLVLAVVSWTTLCTCLVGVVLLAHALQWPRRLRPGTLSNHTTHTSAADNTKFGCPKTSPRLRTPTGASFLHANGGFREAKNRLRGARGHQWGFYKYYHGGERMGMRLDEPGGCRREDWATGRRSSGTYQ